MRSCGGWRKPSWMLYTEFFPSYLKWDQNEHYSRDLCKYNKHFSPETVLPLLLDWAFSLCLKRSYLWACKQSAGGKEFKGCPWANSGGLFHEAKLHINPSSAGAHDLHAAPPCLGGMSGQRPWESHFLSVLACPPENERADGDLLTTGKEEKFKMYKSAGGEGRSWEWWFGYLAPLWLGVLFSHGLVFALVMAILLKECTNFKKINKVAYYCFGVPDVK